MQKKVQSLWDKIFMGFKLYLLLTILCSMKLIVSRSVSIENPLTVDQLWEIRLRTVKPGCLVEGIFCRFFAQKVRKDSFCVFMKSDPWGGISEKSNLKFLLQMIHNYEPKKLRKVKVAKKIHPPPRSPGFIFIEGYRFLTYCIYAHIFYLSVYYRKSWIADL